MFSKYKWALESTFLKVQTILEVGICSSIFPGVGVEMCGLGLWKRREAGAVNSTPG